jgi:hypothetical protein
MEGLDSYIEKLFSQNVNNEDEQIESTMNAINLMYENIGDEMSVESN